MIIGIGGVSNAGKSFLANMIKIDLEKKYKIKILCQDDFIKPESKIPKINGLTDWEHPSSINHDMYYQAIIREAKNNDILISEGLFAFYSDKLTALYDKNIFLYIDKETFINRKKDDLRWGKVPDWYIQHIWDSYLRYGKANNIPGIKKIDASKQFDLSEIINYIAL
ncbi:MAG: hypothetical protein C0595_12985 [Marinilabiliales bacterium]|nr:MAG: hypothetical protein C0595_12985 [Marinilabiliales bacterium]